MNTISEMKQCGLTLIELLLVMAITAILATGGVHGWQGYRQRAALAQSSSELLAFMARIQQAAHWRNETFLLHIAQGGGRSCLTVAGSPAEANCASLGGSVYWPVEENMTLALYQSEIGLGFYGLRNTAGAGHVVIKGAAGSVRVVLSATGRLRRCLEGDNSLGGIPRC